MKLLLATLSITFIIGVLATLRLNYDLQSAREDSRRLRGERDMYNALYRKANTRLAHFQDSINIHCICK